MYPIAEPERPEGLKPCPFGHGAIAYHKQGEFPTCSGYFCGQCMRKRDEELGITAGGPDIAPPPKKDAT